MKERIVIEKGKKEEIQFKNLEKVIDGETCVKLDLYVARKQIKTEQVPETWEELLELCKKLNNKKIEIIFVNIRIIVHLEDNCEISFTEPMSDMWFKKNDIEARIRTDLKPEQMWQIIKSLIGEE